MILQKQTVCYQCSCIQEKTKRKKERKRDWLMHLINSCLFWWTKVTFVHQLKSNIVHVHNNKKHKCWQSVHLLMTDLDIHLKEAQKQGRASAMYFTHQGSLTSAFDPTEEKKYRIKIAVQQHCFSIIRAHTPERQPQKSRKKSPRFKISKEIKRSDSSCYGENQTLQFWETTLLILPQVEVRQEE